MVKSQGVIFNEPYFNHKVEIVGGVLAQECTDVIQAFLSEE